MALPRISLRNLFQGVRLSGRQSSVVGFRVRVKDDRIKIEIGLVMMITMKIEMVMMRLINI